MVKSDKSLSAIGPLNAQCKLSMLGMNSLRMKISRKLVGSI